MLRRHIGRMLLASTAVSVLGTKAAQSQSCTAPCYPQTAAEAAASVTPTNLSYMPGNVRRYGAVATGSSSSDDQPAIQSAHDQARQVGGVRPYLPSGRYRITSTINPCQLGMYGESSKTSVLECVGCHAFTIPSNAGWDRAAPVFEKFGISSQSSSCDSKFAFYFGGVGSGASAIYNSGFTVRDVEIGLSGRMGGGFYLKDLFRANVENVGMTHVSRMIQIVGTVVQCVFRNVRSNNDNAGTALSRYGISTEVATYSNGIGVCENIVFVDCAYIRGSRGINHQAGSHIEFINFDCETDGYGAVINAECYMHGGIIAPSPGTGDWIGISRGVSIPVSYDGTIFDCVDVNTLNTPSSPAQSYGFDLGDGSAPVYGLIIRGCRIRGTASSLADGIRGRILRDATIEDNFFETSCFVGTPINIHGRRLFINRNRVPAGAIIIQDGGDASACGEITYNECSSLSTTLISPSRWTIRNF